MEASSDRRKKRRIGVGAKNEHANQHQHMPVVLPTLPENNTLRLNHDLPQQHKDTTRHNAAPPPTNATHATAPTSNLAANSSAWKQPQLRRRSDSEVSLPASVSFSPPIPRRLRTPDCMSSPVSHLRNLTRNMGDDHRRLHALLASIFVEVPYPARNDRCGESWSERRAKPSMNGRRGPVSPLFRACPPPEAQTGALQKPGWPAARARRA